MVMRHMPPAPRVRGADNTTWRHPMDHKHLGVLPRRGTAHPVGINHAMQFVHVPSASGMDLSPPSTEQADSLSSMDAPSAPTQKTASCVSKINAPQDVILFDGLRRQVPEEIALHGVLALAPPACGSNWVASVSPKAPDSRAQSSATQAPGSEQVERTSSRASESGETMDAPRLPSHAVDVL